MHFSTPTDTQTGHAASLQKVNSFGTFQALATLRQRHRVIQIGHKISLICVCDGAMVDEMRCSKMLQKAHKRREQAAVQDYTNNGKNVGKHLHHHHARKNTSTSV